MPQLIVVEEIQSENPFISGIQLNPGWIGDPPANVLRWHWEIRAPNELSFEPTSRDFGGGGCFFVPTSLVGCHLRVVGECIEPQGQQQVLVRYTSDPWGPIGT